jgi:hypothetical protein
MGALLAHVALSALFTWPLVLNFLPGAGPLVPGTLIVDRDQNLWNLWWVRYALLHVRNPFVTDFIWYPTGVSLYFHTLNVFNGLLAVPLLAVFSLTTTYNVIVLFSFVVGGYGAFLLVHYMCGNRWAALLGSVVFAYSAYHIATMRGLLQLISLEWVPFFVLCLLRAAFAPDGWSKGGPARLVVSALPASLFLLLVSLVDWYYTMYALMLMGLLAVYVVVRHVVWGRSRQAVGGPVKAGWQDGVGRPLLCMGVVVCIYLALVSPILVPTLRELGTSHYMLPDPDEPLRFSADLLAFFQPPRFNRLWGHAFTNRDRWPFGNNTYEVYLTYTALFLAGVALVASRSARPMLHSGTTFGRADAPWRAAEHNLPGKWFWAGCGLVFFLLALGPVLQVNGTQVRGLPMPYLALARVPVLNISRSPDRFAMPLTLCMGVLAGYGTNVIAQVAGRAGRQGAVRLEHAGAAVALGGVVLTAMELAPMPYPQRPAEVPRWYHMLSGEAGDFAIFELPPQDDYWHGALRMYGQTVHGKRIFWGYISREYPHPFVTGTPGYQELVYADGMGDMFLSTQDIWLSAFATYDTRYIVLQKVRQPGEAPPQGSLAPFREAISRVLGDAARPVYEDDQVEVYRVPLPAGRVPFLNVGDGWQPREVGPNGSFRWMGQRATVDINSPSAQQAYLVFRATTVGPPRRLQIYHGDHLVFDAQISGLQEYTTRGPLGLPVGISTLTFVSPEGTVSPASLGLGNDPRQLSFAILDLHLEAVR